VAIQTAPEAREHFHIASKGLLSFPLLGELKDGRHVQWPVRRWSWKPTFWKLVVECPTNPHAQVEVRIDYGGVEWESAHF
ncbi:MAG: hypothetical protein KDB22_23565, partial [Planctomycetales bacterium]|nr:hypothetical protein [Planctomycetales bacterium]